MTRCIMGFQIFLLVVCFTGIRAQYNPMDRCLEEISIQDQLESATNIGNEEELNKFCTVISRFFTCMHEVVYEQTGLTVQEMAIHLKGTDIGKALAVFVNIEHLIVDICTEGTQIRKDYLENAKCFEDIDDNQFRKCQYQSMVASESFKDVPIEPRNNQIQLDPPCFETAYIQGCLGVAVQEHCGDKGFKTYKEIVKRIGFLKSGICSPDVVSTIKTSFLESLKTTKSRKKLYQVIFDQRKRRK